MTYAATVLATLEGQALVELDGRDRLVDSLLVPDLRSGDDVLVGMGCVLARLDRADAARIRADRERLRRLEGAAARGS